MLAAATMGIPGSPGGGCLMNNCWSMTMSQVSVDLVNFQALHGVTWEEHRAEHMMDDLRFYKRISGWRGFYLLSIICHTLLADYFWRDRSTCPLQSRFSDPWARPKLVAMSEWSGGRHSRNSWQLEVAPHSSLRGGMKEIWHTSTAFDISKKLRLTQRRVFRLL